MINILFYEFCTSKLALKCGILLRCKMLPFPNRLFKAFISHDRMGGVRLSYKSLVQIEAIKHYSEKLLHWLKQIIK